MNQQNYRLGIVADLSPNGSVHQATFLRAVKTGFKSLKGAERNVELVWANDRASYEGGKESAQELMANKVDLVLGHYSSSAAKGAFPFYEAKEVPALLPAATADFLTQQFQTAYRVCGKDSDHVDLIIRSLLAKGVREINLSHDGSVHGISLTRLIETKIRATGAIGLTEDKAAEHIIFVGFYDNSIAFVKKLPPRVDGPHQIYFADDLAHKDLPADLGDTPHDIFIFGCNGSDYFKTAKACVQEYQDLWSCPPGAYYLETYAAMQIALDALVAWNREGELKQVLSTKVYPTVLGNFDFNDKGESGFINLILWKLHNDEFKIA